MTEVGKLAPGPIGLCDLLGNVRELTCEPYRLVPGWGPAGGVVVRGGDAWDQAAAYVASGGLKACAWADLIQGSALIFGGGVIMYFALHQFGETPLANLASSAPVPDGLTDADGGVAKFTALNSHKFHMVLPGNDPFLPWTTLILGLWIPNFYYWGLNQYIMQRTLGSQSLAQGQKGIVFAALMKLMIPFIIVMLGMIAFTRLGNHGESDAGMANGISFEPGNRMNHLIGRNISALIPEHQTHEPSLNSNAEKR